MEVDKYEPSINQVESRVHILQVDCQADASAELEQKLQGKQMRVSCS